MASDLHTPSSLRAWEPASSMHDPIAVEFHFNLEYPLSSPDLGGFPEFDDKGRRLWGWVCSTSTGANAETIKVVYAVEHEIAVAMIDREIGSPRFIDALFVALEWREGAVNAEWPMTRFWNENSPASVQNGTVFRSREVSH